MPNEALHGWIRANVLNATCPVASGTNAQEYVTDHVAGFKFVVTKVTSIVQVIGSTSSATRLFRLIKGASTVVASKTIALADVGTMGLKIDWTLSTTSGDLTFEDADTLTIDSPAAGSSSYGSLTLGVMVQGRQRPQQL